LYSGLVINRIDELFKLHTNVLEYVSLPLIRSSSPKTAPFPRIENLTYLFDFFTSVEFFVKPFSVN